MFSEDCASHECRIELFTHNNVFWRTFYKYSSDNLLFKGCQVFHSLDICHLLNQPQTVVYLAFQLFTMTNVSVINNGLNYFLK